MRHHVPQPEDHRVSRLRSTPGKGSVFSVHAPASIPPGHIPPVHVADKK
ncbi:hypothetical protein [Achromobacter sp. MYb9]|nr:hypothetical protein [Achromobacter sp. MYb9]